jgi:hypothetical protein
MVYLLYSGVLSFRVLPPLVDSLFPHDHGEACSLLVITEYTECQAFYPVAQIGSPHPIIRKRVLPPTLTHLLRGEGVGGPNSDDWTDALSL